MRNSRISLYALLIVFFSVVSYNSLGPTGCEQVTPGRSCAPDSGKGCFGQNEIAFLSGETKQCN
jgi:hypothetical protein